MKFLVVDDNSVDLLIAKAAVQRFNPDFQVTTTDNAEDALNYLRQNGENLPDIILLDLNMPVKNGWDFLKEFAQLRINSIKIYILTSSVNEAEKIMADKNPFVTQFISKPLRIETVETICSTSSQPTISR